MERRAPIYTLERVDSTNTRLKELARQGAADGTVLIAREQTGGRGRLGRGFASPPGGLYLSMLLRPPCAAERCSSLTPLAALAVRRAAAACAGVTPEIKWPNDLLLHGKKLCGILTELLGGAEAPQVVVGVGLNVDTAPEDFPEELRESACSLRGETGKRVAPETLARRLVTELDALYAAWLREERGLLEEYRAACATVGQEILVLQNGAGRPARALGVNEDFSLAVAYADGSREDLRFGEVSVRPGGTE